MLRPLISLPRFYRLHSVPLPLPRFFPRAMKEVRYSDFFGIMSPRMLRTLCLYSHVARLSLKKLGSDQPLRSFFPHLFLSSSSCCYCFFRSFFRIYERCCAQLRLSVSSLSLFGPFTAFKIFPQRKPPRSSPFFLLFLVPFRFLPLSSVFSYGLNLI